MSEAIKAAREMREAAAFAAEMFGTDNRAASMKPWSREDDIALIVERDYALANHIRALPLPEAKPDPRAPALAKAREALGMAEVHLNEMRQNAKWHPVGHSLEDLKWIITERPAKKWGARKAPCPTCGFHITTRNATPFAIEDDGDNEQDKPKETDRDD